MKKELKPFKAFINKVDVTTLLKDSLAWRHSLDYITFTYNGKDLYYIRIISQSIILVHGGISGIFEITEKYYISDNYSVGKLFYKKVLFRKNINKSFKIVIQMSHIHLVLQYTQSLLGFGPPKVNEYMFCPGLFKNNMNYKNIINNALKQWYKNLNIKDLINIFIANNIKLLD